MLSYKRKCAAGLVLAAVAACGGGGGGGGSAPPPADDRVSLTADNASAVTETVLGSVVAVMDVGGIVGGTPVAATGPVFTGMKHAKSVTARGQQAAIAPETLPCLASGTMTLSGNVANPYTLSAGDTITVSFDACNDGGGVIDGAFDGTVVEFTGDLDLIQARLTLDVNATDLAVTADGQTVTTDGGYTFTIDTLNAPLFSLEISGNSLRVVSPADTITLERFSEQQTQNLTAVPRPVTFEASGSLTSSALGGRVEYSTPVRFEAFNDDFPYAGELLITGASESTVRFVALNETNVRLDVDPDADGTVEHSIDSLWTDVLAP